MEERIQQLRILIIISEKKKKDDLNGMHFCLSDENKSIIFLLLRYY